MECWSTKAAISLKRLKIEETLLWRAHNHYSNNDPARYRLRSATDTNYSVHVRGRNLTTELSLWSGQSCGTVYSHQFVTRTVCILSNADSNLILARVLVIDNVTLFGSAVSRKGTNLPSTTTPTCVFNQCATEFRTFMQ